MTDLASIFSTLQRRHVATTAAPLPPPSVGITWIWAANGLWKRGTDQHLDILVPVKSWSADEPSSAGLATLLPSVRWRNRAARRLPGALLQHVLDHARLAADERQGVARPIEQHYCFVQRDGKLRLVVPVQRATAGSVRYRQPDGDVLLDLHSHHGMAAYFSATDDRDDAGLSVSAVIGRIYDQPQLLVRLNCYGDRVQVPPLSVFDALGPFEDAGWQDANGREREYATTHH
jgi:PRTRC genetic system protein A